MQRLILSACLALLVAVSMASMRPDASHLSQPEAAHLVMKPLEKPLPLLVPYLGLMTGIIGWSAYGIADLAKQGGPRTERDWDAAGMAAVNLVATSTLLSMEGPGTGDIHRYSHPEWKSFVSDFQNASLLVALAVHTRDAADYLQFADLLADTCEACHRRFKTAPPDATTELTGLAASSSGH